MIVSEQNEPSSTRKLTIMSSMIGIVDGLLTLRAYGCIWRILGIHGLDLVKPNAEGNDYPLNYGNPFFSAEWV
jgi:hypothetical protein